MGNFKNVYLSFFRKKFFQKQSFFQTNFTLSKFIYIYR